MNGLASTYWLQAISDTKIRIPIISFLNHRLHKIKSSNDRGRHGVTDLSRACWDQGHIQTSICYSSVCIFHLQLYAQRLLGLCFVNYTFNKKKII